MSVDSPSISAIITTFNRPRELERAIASALRQTSPVDEIVVVDDGSTHDASRLCARFGSSVRYLARNRGGVSAARNAGAQIARGDLLAFLDDDDQWEPDKLCVQIAVLTSHPTLGWCCTDSLNVTTEDSPLPKDAQGFDASFPAFRDGAISAREHFGRTLVFEERVMCGAHHEVFLGDLYESLFLGNFVYPSSSLIRREVFHEAGKFDASFVLAEETEFFHRLSSRSHGAVILSPLIRYTRTDSGSMTSGANTTKLIRAAIASGERAFALRPDAGLSTRLAHQVGVRLLSQRLALAELADGNGPAARWAIRDLRRAGGNLSLRLLAYLALSFAPVQLIEALKAGRRALRRG